MLRFLLMLLALISSGAANPQSQKPEQPQTQQQKPTAQPTPRYAPYPSWQADACYNAKDHNAAALCAQWRAAVAAEKAAHEARRATSWSIVATVFTAFAFGV